MARAVVVSLVLIFSRTSPALAWELAVAVTNDCLANRQMFSVATQEATRIWADAGVTFRWVDPSGVPYRSASDWIAVSCSSGPAPTSAWRAPRVLPVAAIRFINGQPTNSIVVNLTNARLLLRREPIATRDVDEWPRAVADLRLGRMVGRAIAHEIGHFVNQSSAHTRHGLMKASHPVAALIGESLVPFRIDRADLVARRGEERDDGVPPAARAPREPWR